MEILFENDDLTVCVKEPGMLSEDFEEGAREEAAPAEGREVSGFKKLDSVPAALLRRWGDPRAYVGVISRLDAPVGGVMVYARNPETAAWLTKQLQEGSLEKEYICVCEGIPEPSSGKMRDFLFKDRRTRKVFPVKGRRKGAKEAVLFYDVLDTRSFGEDTVLSLCRVRLATGRTHQIRVQFASRKHPLPGDRKYGGMTVLPINDPLDDSAADTESVRKLEISSPLLYCRSLRFCPNEKSAPVSFSTKPPEAFISLVPSADL